MVLIFYYVEWGFMETTFLKKAIDFSSKAKEFQDAAFNEFKERRVELNVDSVFDLENYSTQDKRNKCRTIIEEYLKQLVLELEFVEKHYIGILGEMNSMIEDFSIQDKSSFFARVIPNFIKNYELSKKIIFEKKEAILKVKELLLLFDEMHSQNISVENKIKMGPVWIAEMSYLNEKIDRHLAEQESLANKQREFDGEYMERLYKMFSLFTKF